MLIFRQHVQRLIDNTNLSSHVRYLGARWAELLDYKSHPVVSAVLRIDPSLWFEELNRTAGDYISDEGDRFPMMLDLFKRSTGLLGSRPDVNRWFPKEVAAFRSDAKSIQPHPSAPWPTKQAHVLSVVRAAQSGALQSLRAALSDPTNGYRARLFAAIRSEVALASTSSEAWARLDDNIGQLAACMLSEGRSGRSLAEATARAMAEASSDSEALLAFVSLAQAPKEDFLVAVVLEGARSVRAPQDYGFLPASAGFTGVPQSVTSILETFLDQHSCGTQTCGLLVPVSAWDYISAREGGLLLAQRLQDQLTAEHRLSRFSLNDSVCVYRVSTKRASVLTTEVAFHSEARARVSISRGPLTRSLRYNALSRTERSPVIAVVHAWIALENLGADVHLFDKKAMKMVPGKPASFVFEHVPSVVLLSAAKNMFTVSWQLFGRLGRKRDPARWGQLELWIGATAGGQSVDLDKWSGLLTRAARPTKSRRKVTTLAVGATQADAAAYLCELVPNFGPLAERRLDEILERLRNGTTFAGWATNYRLLAGANMARLRRLRNEAVHKAVSQQEGARHLALAGQAVLDSTYEMAVAWLPGRTPSRALELAGRRSLKRLQSWSKTTGPASVSVSALSGP